MVLIERENLFVIISNGKIRVEIETQKKPLARATDAQEAIFIKYFGFASYDDSLARFYYNCTGQNARQNDEISSVDLRNRKRHIFNDLCVHDIMCF